MIFKLTRSQQNWAVVLLLARSTNTHARMVELLQQTQSANIGSSEKKGLSLKVEFMYHVIDEQLPF